jgi:ferrous iron transport protein A
MFNPFTVTGCSLELLRTEERGIIAFYKSQDETILKKLTAMGLIPGVTISIKQRFPSLLIKVGSTILKLDREATRAIYVRLLDN